MEKLTLEIRGRPIEVRYARDLRDRIGNAAHAATYIRQRLVILDADLRNDPEERCRILAHELLHFAWVRLGNARRRKWMEVLESQWRSHSRGEAGWSAEWRKQTLQAEDLQARNLRWRDYCCEAFCDTGAVLWSGVSSEVTLPAGHMRRRAAWFKDLKEVPL